MLARDKGNFDARGGNRTRDPPVQWLPEREFNSRLGYGNFPCPSEHGFSSFQVENDHWECMCAAH